MDNGIIRRFDALGRIVIPKELRDGLGIDTKTPVEIHKEDNRIIIQVHQKGCVLCGSQDELVEYKNQNICRNCIDYL